MSNQQNSSTAGARGAPAPVIDFTRFTRDLPEFFIISCWPTDGFFRPVANERATAEKLDITDVEFFDGAGIYERREDAEAVIAYLAPENPGMFFCAIGSRDI